MLQICNKTGFFILSFITKSTPAFCAISQIGIINSIIPKQKAPDYSISHRRRLFYYFSFDRSIETKPHTCSYDRWEGGVIPTPRILPDAKQICFCQPLSNKLFKLFVKYPLTLSKQICYNTKKIFRQVICVKKCICHHIPQDGSHQHYLDNVIN